MLTSSLTNIVDDWGNTKKNNTEKRRKKKSEKKVWRGIENKLAFADDYVKNSFLKYSWIKNNFCVNNLIILGLE